MATPLDIIHVPWNQFPPMKVWRVVKKVAPHPDSGWRFSYEAADSKYKGYPHRADAIAEAQRLTTETGAKHVTIQAWLVAVEKTPDGKAVQS